MQQWFNNGIVNIKIINRRVSVFLVHWLEFPGKGDPRLWTCNFSPTSLHSGSNANAEIAVFVDVSSCCSGSVGWHARTTETQSGRVGICFTSSIRSIRHLELSVDRSFLNVYWFKLSLCNSV